MKTFLAIIGFCTVGFFLFVVFAPDPPNMRASLASNAYEPGGTSTRDHSRPLTNSPIDRGVDLGKVQLKVIGVRREAFDTAASLDYLVTNKNPYPIRDIRVECDEVAKSGTKVGVLKKTIYDRVPGNGSKTFKKFSMGFVHSQIAQIACGIEAAERG